MARRRLLAIVAMGAGLCGLAGCGKSSGDAVCRDGEATETGLRVTAGTDEYFYAVDGGGRQVGYQRAGQVLALPPGDYRVKINNSQRGVTVRAGRVTTCTAGDVRVTGGTDAYFYILDTLGTQLSYQRIGGLLSVLPGRYLVKVNNSRSGFEVHGGDTVTLPAGTVSVAGTTDEYYYVLDTLGTQLAYERLGRLLDVFPGGYVLKLNNATARTAVSASDTMMLRSGTLSALGTTDEYYYVLDTAGTQLGYARLGSATSYLPGRYRVKVNNADTLVAVPADSSTRVATGTVVVHGAGTEYYYVNDATGRQLSYSRLGAPLALLPGSYSVKLGQRMTTVSVAAGATVIARP
ncbi:MAG: hypothetical protein Q8Q85_16540 [Gemmatimonadales bacterium]|nr:hypothetical protein [Gemmatimonadales bacterium]